MPPIAAVAPRPLRPLAPRRAVAARGPVAQPGDRRQAAPTGDALATPNTYQARVIALVAKAQIAQQELARAHQANDPAAIQGAVQTLEGLQADLGVARLLGARRAADWAPAFDFNAFWNEQQRATPDLMVVDGRRGGTGAPEFGDAQHYQNFAIRLVGQAIEADAALARAKATGSAPAIATAQAGLQAAEAELVLMRAEAKANRIAWRFRRGFDVMGFWKAQAKALPKSVDLTRTALPDQVRVGGRALKADVVVRLWDGVDGRQAVAGNNCDNVVFKLKDGRTYVATAVDLGLPGAPDDGTRVAFQGQDGVVVDATRPVNSIGRAAKRSSREFFHVARMFVAAPFTWLIGGCFAFIGAINGSLKLAAMIPVVGLGAMGLLFAVMGAAMAMAFFRDVSLYRAQAHGVPQHVVGPAKD